MIEEINTLLSFLTAAKEPKGYVIPARRVAKTVNIARTAKNIKKMRAAVRVELEPVSGEPITIEAMLSFLKGRKENDK